MLVLHVALANKTQEAWFSSKSEEENVRASETEAGHAHVGSHTHSEQRD